MSMISTALIQRVHGRGTATLDRVYLAMIVVAVLLKLHLVFQLNVNWDEFLYLAKVHLYLRGEPLGKLQSFQVHFFTWLPYVSDNEISQIVAARLVMFALGVGASILIYAIARRFFARTASMFAVFCWLSFSFVIEHGTSFRADPIVTLLFLAALHLLLRREGNPREAAAAGLIMAIALLVTIKSAFYVATLGAVFLCLLVGARKRVEIVKAGTVFAAAGGAGLPLLYGLHSLTLAAPESGSTGSVLAGTYQQMISFGVVPPAWRYLAVGVGENVFFWLLLLAGAGFAATRAVDVGGRARAWLLLSLLTPLATIIFYRNAFPYYYVVVLSSAAVLCGGVVEWLVRRREAQAAGRLALLVPLMFVVMFGKLVGHYLQNADDGTVAQRQVVEAVHRAFPRPVPYIDRSSMISSFPKVGIFMSTGVMERYLSSGRPVFGELLARRQPLFLLANISSLDLARPLELASGAMGYRLMAEDFSVLRDNFVPHWGLLWVAGKQLTFTDSAVALDFGIIVPGIYTVEAGAAVTVDGVRHAPGETVWLGPGRHRMAIAAAPSTVVLRWGDHLYRPAETPPEGPVFTGF